MSGFGDEQRNTGGVSMSPLTDGERAHVLEVSAEFNRRHQVTERDARWRHLRPLIEADLPTLHLDDVSGIPFLQDIVGIEYYQLRARVRAGSGDVFAATCPDPGLESYEAYNRTHLGLGEARLIHAPHSPAIEVAAGCRASGCFETLVGLAQQHGGLMVHPYMGIEAVWALADAIHHAAGVPVGVIAPAPGATWFANDKLTFTDFVRAILGNEAVVPSLVGDSPQALAGHLIRLAQHHDHVALKMLRCASAMGNKVFRAAEIAVPRPQLVEKIQRFLHEKEWEVGSKVLAVAWEPATASPSAQMWIPADTQLPPSVDGVYEQLLEGPNKMFLGSVPSQLGHRINHRVARASSMIALGYQALGYVGRCSFDTIIHGDTLRFIECNGRWGGTSTPMHLLDRVFPRGRPPYRAQDVVIPSLNGATFSDLMCRLGPHLYDRRTQTGRYILYNVGSLTQYGKFDVIALGDDLDQAATALERHLPSLLT